MLDPDELYELADDLPVLDSPVLIQALTGFVDAGSAIQLSREHLLEQPGAPRSSRPSTSTSCSITGPGGPR